MKTNIINSFKAYISTTSKNNSTNSIGQTNVSNPISFGRKHIDSDSFSKEDNNNVIEVKGFDKDYGGNFIAKQTPEGKMLERKISFEEEKDFWINEKYTDGVMTERETYKDGEMLSLTEYINGVVSKLTLYSHSEEASFTSLTREEMKFETKTIPHHIAKIEEYKNGILNREKSFYDDGKSLHLDYQYDDDGKLIDIKSYRENGDPYHSIWEHLNGFRDENECEDEFGIPYRDYKKIFGPKKSLPWGKK